MKTPDLYNVQFWWVVAIAVVVLVPLRHPGLRRWAFACINLMMVWLMLKSGVVTVATLAVVAWLILRSFTGRPGAIALAVGGVGALVLFLIHKRPDLGAAMGLTRIEPVLAAIGYSYVALRWVDMARAVWERRQRPPDLPSTVNYLLPFHMLAAGPIQAYDEFATQPAVPDPLSSSAALRAIERISFGLFKKYVVAQFLQRLLLTGFHAGGAYTLLEIQVTYIWLYLDFSAYSDIAVGIGRLIGMKAPENFNRPYLARNAIEFWERWHISLSMFIRRNVFFPIQLALMRWDDGRHPLAIASGAFLVSFLLCGLWHSIGWVWAAWGLYQALGLIVCNLYRHFLTRRLGRKGVARYMANPWIHLAMTILTFEFAAVGVAIVTYPFQELNWWTLYPR